MPECLFPPWSCLLRTGLLDSVTSLCIVSPVCIVIYLVCLGSHTSVRKEMIMIILAKLSKNQCSFAKYAEKR